MREWMNLGFCQVRRRAAASRHVHEIHIANISATATTATFFSPLLWKKLINKTSSHQLLSFFSKDDKCKKKKKQLLADSLNFLLDPLMIYWGKQKVIWCVRWEESCRRSDMGAGVRPGSNVLLNELRHFWLKRLPAGRRHRVHMLISKQLTLA